MESILGAFRELGMQMFITGISLGLLYGLIAVGLSLIFGILRVIQYAHGELYMLGGYALYYLCVGAGVPYWVAVVMSCVIIFLLSMGIQFVLLRPLMVRGTLTLDTLAMTIALVFIIPSAGLEYFGTVVRGIPSVVRGGVEVFGAYLSYERLVISILAALVLGGLYYFLHKAKTGIAMRAVAEDPETSSLQGINTQRIHMLGFGLGSALAAFAGCLVGTLMSIIPSMGFSATVKAFIMVIMGGLGSIPGALVGGFIIGMIDSFVGTLFSSELGYIVGFITVFIILVFKPSGLFGLAWE